MRQSRLSLLIAGAFFLFAVTSCTIGTNAQSVSTGVVVGTINDPGGAVVLDATVTLQNKATNSQVTQRTNGAGQYTRSEEHTSELQSQSNLVCRLLLEKKK